MSAWMDWGLAWARYLWPWLIVAFLVLVLWRSRWIYAPLWLIPKGRFVEARKHYEAYGKPPLGWLPSARHISRYGVALCLHGEGDPEGAMAELRGIDEDQLRQGLRFGVDTLWAYLLLHEERDPEEVLRRVRRARQTADAPDLRLMEAHAEWLRGAREAAQAIFDEVVDDPKGSFHLDRQAAVRRDAKMVSDSVALWRGWFLLRLGNGDAARPHLEAASRGAPGPGQRRAATLLARLGTGPEEPPPPSLTPVTRDVPKP